MHRISFLTIMLLILAAGLWAQSSSAVLSFKLLEAADYDLDMLYSSELQRLDVQVDFVIPKSSLDPQCHYGVFLDKDAELQSYEIADQYMGHYFVKNLKPVNFIPELRQPELLNEGGSVLFFGLKIPDYDKLPELVHVKLNYIIVMPDFQLGKSNKMTTVLDASQFWYPRNISEDSTINLTLTTTPYMTLLIGNSYAAKIDKDYSRIHKSTFIETVEQPVSFRLIRD